MKKILFLSNHFVTLYSFRREMISRMVKEGYDVYLSLPANEENKYFEMLGCKIIITKIDRRGINPLRDLLLIKQYKEIIKEINPDIIFSFTIKPNIYGTMASNGYRKNHICNITGTGATFLRENWLSKICRFLYRHSVKECKKVYFQNKGDLEYFWKHNMIKENNFYLLPGSGCNIDDHKFSYLPPQNKINFIYIGRVMKLKGIDEFLECARIIKQKYPYTNFYIAGWNEEPKYMELVKKAENEGYINYLGYRKDIDECIKQCHCTILASHGGEGVPNVLLESAANGRICIASRISGSQDVIEDGITGYLFENKDVVDLVNNVEKFLALTPQERQMMGLLGRKKIEKEFNREIVINAYLADVLKA